MRAIALLSAALALTACHAMRQRRGEPARPCQRDFPVAGAFDKIALAGSPDVVVTVGGAASVRAEGERRPARPARDRQRERPASDRPAQCRRRQLVPLGRHRGHHRPCQPAGAGRRRRIAGSGDMRIDRVQGPAFAAAVDRLGRHEHRQPHRRPGELHHHRLGRHHRRRPCPARPTPRSPARAISASPSSKPRPRRWPWSARAISASARPRRAAIDTARLGRRDRHRPGPLHDQQGRLRRRPLRRLRLLPA